MENDNESRVGKGFGGASDLLQDIRWCSNKDTE
jgi:hypothetical protein